MRPVKLRNRDREVEGNLRLPLPFDNAKTYPALVCIGPRGGLPVTSGGYGAGLTRLGYITLALDLAPDEDEMRTSSAGPSVESASNVSAAIDFLLEMSIVDGRRVGIVGIGSASRAADAAMADERIRAVVSIPTAEDHDACHGRNATSGEMRDEDKHLLVVEPAGDRGSVENTVLVETTVSQIGKFLGEYL